MAESMSVPYCCSDSNTDISPDTVIRILKDPDKDKPVCHFPAVNKYYHFLIFEYLQIVL